MNQKFRWAIRDVLLAPFTLVAALVLRFQRAAPLGPSPLARAIFRRVGVFPLRDQYYEPAFLTARGDALGPERDLLGIDFRVSSQLELLNSFTYSDELRGFPITRASSELPSYYYANGFFESGDGECLYQVLRSFKPQRMIEIGSGFSTLMAASALRRNSIEGYTSTHTCIEPFSNSWLEKVPDIEVIRTPVEEVGIEVFSELDAGDVLFIDSTHMIRPGGDVLFEYLRLLPSLREGVLIHIHDIFTPYDYPEKAIIEDGIFWNEQYLLEAFLSFNSHFQIVVALNMLARQHPQAIASVFPIYADQGGRRPLGSIWLQRVSPQACAERI